MMTPEARARARIDAALEAAGWAVQDRKAVNLGAARGVAIREFPLRTGYGEADYLLFADGQAVGIVEAKPEGATLTGVEPQSEKYGAGLPAQLDAPVQPLPFLYQSTGVETRFTNGLDPEPRSRRVFAFHRPETLAGWLDPDAAAAQASGNGLGRAAEDQAPYGAPRTMKRRLQSMPPLADAQLWPAQRAAILNLEQSLAAGRRRALIQMTMGSGKTVTAISAIYRLLKLGGASRVLFLVDRRNLGRQALKEFQGYDTPDDGRKFTQLYNVQLLTSSHVDPAARVVITTIQRLYASLLGKEEVDEEVEEAPDWESFATLNREPVAVAYNAAIPIETFDVVFTDECHRSIYNLWRQVLEYFDAALIGLTATPSKQTLGFFESNLVMEYGYEQAVADGVNVDHDIYRIRTKITERGATVESGFWVDLRDRQTRAVRWRQLDEDFSYAANALDRDVVAPDQIRTVIRTFKEKLPEIFPGRTEVPKTLIYAKDDSHADDIVQIVRDTFGRGNDFCEKITYRTGTARIVTRTTDEVGEQIEQITYKSSGVTTDHLLNSFRNSYMPRIVVTVDMIATGTDVKPLEIVMFLRAVRSRIFFEQMKGRGARVVDETELRSVNPGNPKKDRFVLIDCVGVTEDELVDTRPLERQPSVGLGRLLELVSFGSVDPEVLSSVASRLARLDRQLGPPERDALERAGGGTGIREIASRIVAALDPDRQAQAAREAAGLPGDAEPSPKQIADAGKALLKAAAAPLATNPTLRQAILDVKQRAEQVIDTVSQDELIAAGYAEAARERARATITSFRQYLEENRDEITALQVLYSRPYAQRLRLRDIRELAQAIASPPRSWTGEALWRAYAALERDRVRGSGGKQLTDLVALVRFALQQEDELVPFPDQVRTRFAGWLALQETAGRAFTEEQRRWLELIRDQVAASLGVDMEDFDLPPFAQLGGAGRASQLFGLTLAPLLAELNEVLVA
jgi:type I restriction enzyme R subunit